MIGTKLYKKTDDMKKYSKCAVWCNTNNAHIEDRGDYYEVVANKEVSAELELANKIGAVNDEYEAARNELAGYFIKAMLEGDTDTQMELQEEMAELKADYLSQISDIKTEEE